MDMDILNFIAVVLCGTLIFWHKYNKNIFCMTIDIMLTLLNLPFAIKWLIEFFK